MKTFHRGTDVNLDTIVYTDDELTTVKTDLAGSTITGRIGNKAKRTTHVEVTGSIVDAALGQIRCTFTDVQTDTLGPGVYDFITEVIDAGGNKGITTDEQIEVLASLKTP